MKTFIRIAAVLLFLFSCSPLFAQDVNVILKDGTVLKGNLLGKTDSELFLEAQKGKSKIIKIADTQTVFDVATGKIMEFTAAAPEEKKPVKAEAKKAETTAPAEKPAEKDQYSIYTPVSLNKWSVPRPEEKINLFERTGGGYFQFNIGLNYLFLSESTVTAAKTYAESIPEYSSPDGWFESNLGMDFDFLIRPCDFFALGGFANTTNGPNPYWSSSFDLSLPTNYYGAIFRFIPYSEDTQDFQGYFYVDVRTGVGALGPFGYFLADSQPGYSLKSSDTPYYTRKFSGSAPMTSVMVGMAFGKDYIFDLSIGYRACKIDRITYAVTKSNDPAQVGQTGPVPMELDLSGFVIECNFAGFSF